MNNINLIIQTEKKNRLLRLTLDVTDGTMALHKICHLIHQSGDFTLEKISKFIDGTYENEYEKLVDNKLNLLKEVMDLPELNEVMPNHKAEIENYIAKLGKMIDFKNSELSVNFLSQNVRETLKHIKEKKDSVIKKLNWLERKIVNSSLSIV